MPQYPKPATYQAKIDRELERLWINKTSIMVLALGRDKFSLSDGNRSLTAHGSTILRVLTKLQDKAGYSKLWEAFHNVEKVRFSSTRKVIHKV